MKQLNITIRNSENIETLDAQGVEKISDIVQALVTSGGLTGVKGGKTIIHFDADGVFQGVELNYWPFRRRKRL